MEYIAPAVASGIASGQEALAAYNASMQNYIAANPDGGTPAKWSEFNEAWNSYEQSTRTSTGYKPVVEQSGYRSINTALTDRPQATGQGLPTEQDYKDLQAASEQPTSNTYIPSDIAAGALGDKALLAAAGAVGALAALSAQNTIDQQNKPLTPINNRPIATPTPGPTPTGDIPSQTPVPVVAPPSIAELMDGVGGYYATGNRRRRIRRRFRLVV